MEKLHYLSTVRAAIVLCVVGMIGCSKDDGNIPDDPNVERIFEPSAETLGYIADGLKLTCDGSGFDVSFYTNKNWKIAVEYISESQDWLRIDTKSGRPGDIVIGVWADENTEVENRSAILTITSGGINEYISVTQTSAMSNAIHVDTPGTLSNLIEENARPYVTDLTITGEINGTDIRLIRSLFGTLQTLDLSAATIVSGGDAYNIYYPEFLTEYSCVSAYMFMGYNGTELKLPDNTQFIGYMSLFGMPNLKELTLPERVAAMSGAAISGCNSLRSLTIPQSVVIVDNEGLIGYDYLMLTSFPKLESLTVLSPSVLLWVDVCGSLKTMDLYCNLKEYSVCQPHPALTSVTLHEGISEIPQWVFTDCPGLKTITIPSTVKSIGYNAFAHYNADTKETASYLEEIHCRCTKSPWRATLIEGFKNCTLYVPRGCLDGYSAIAYNFKAVVEE